MKTSSTPLSSSAQQDAENVMTQHQVIQEKLNGGLRFYLRLLAEYLPFGERKIVIEVLNVFTTTNNNSTIVLLIEKFL